MAGLGSCCCCCVVLGPCRQQKEIGGEDEDGTRCTFVLANIQGVLQGWSFVVLLPAAQPEVGDKDIGTRGEKRLNSQQARREQGETDALGMGWERKQKAFAQAAVLSCAAGKRNGGNVWHGLGDAASDLLFVP